MTDPELIEKKLAEIDTYVHQLRTIADREKLRTDVKEEKFVAHTLQLAIQAALDAASHIVSDQRLGEPRTNRELFTLLERAGWLAPGLSTRLRDMAGLHNLLVHAYSEVDLRIVDEILAHRLDDLTNFADTLRSRLTTS